MEKSNREQELRIPGTPVNPQNPDIVWDLNGYPMNAKHPPVENECGAKNQGYQTVNRAIIFYDFAVQRYDLKFKYKNKFYYIYSCEEYVALSDNHFTKKYEIFPSANAFIENFKIDGRPLIDLIDELEDVEPV